MNSYIFDASGADYKQCPAGHFITSYCPTHNEPNGYCDRCQVCDLCVADGKAPVAPAAPVVADAAAATGGTAAADDSAK